jgi:hypothetical protein
MAKKVPIGVSVQSSESRYVSNTWRWMFPDQSEIMNIMDDQRAFSVHLKSEVKRTGGKVYSNGIFAATEILPLLHRLLSLSVATVNTDKQGSDMLQACRLGCILYLAEIRCLFGIMGIISTLQTKKLRNFLEASANDWKEFELLKVWCLAMGAMESFGSLRAWYIAELGKASGKLSISSWDDMERQLRGVLWYDQVHTPMFRGLFDGSGANRRLDHHILGGSRFGGYRPIR